MFATSGPFDSASNQRSITVSISCGIGFGDLAIEKTQNAVNETSSDKAPPWKPYGNPTATYFRPKGMQIPVTIARLQAHGVARFQLTPIAHGR
jgi:hypothetical protein